MELTISTKPNNKSIKAMFIAALLVIVAADFVIEMPLIERYESIGQYQGVDSTDGGIYGGSSSDRAAEYTTYQAINNVDKPSYEELY